MWCRPIDRDLVEIWREWHPVDRSTHRVDDAAEEPAPDPDRRGCIGRDDASTRSGSAKVSQREADADVRTQRDDLGGEEPRGCLDHDRVSDRGVESLDLELETDDTAHAAGSARTRNPTRLTNPRADQRAHVATLELRCHAGTSST
jgi:hypothetical protein